MKYNSDIHHRRSIRLKGYDYSSAGIYFVTICTGNGVSLFGEVIDGEMKLNDAGRMVEQVWCDVPQKYVGFNIKEYIVMPNHFHAIIEILDVGADQAQGGRTQGSARTLGDIVQRFKSYSMHKYIEGVKEYGWKRFNKRLWHRNYWEHIIRDEDEYFRIARYIKNNPKEWMNDKLNGGTGNNIIKDGGVEYFPWVGADHCVRPDPCVCPGYAREWQI